MSDRPTPPTFDPYPWNQNGPGRSHRPEVMYPCDDGEWVKLDDYRDLERKLAEANESLRDSEAWRQANLEQCREAKAKLAEAREALEFYGKESRYQTPLYDDRETNNVGLPWPDKGHCAREALARIDANQQKP